MREIARNTKDYIIYYLEYHFSIGHQKYVSVLLRAALRGFQMMMIKISL